MKREIGIVTCENCGHTYSPDLAADRKAHERYHYRFSIARMRCGWLVLTDKEEKELYAEADAAKEFGERYGKPSMKALAFELKTQILQARSYEASGWNESHPDYWAYTAMLLNQPRVRASLEPEVLEILLHDFGSIPGLAGGTTFYKGRGITKAQRALIAGAYWRRKDQYARDALEDGGLMNRYLDALTNGNVYEAGRISAEMQNFLRNELLKGLEKAAPARQKGEGDQISTAPGG